jgi:hypothetical protein
MFVLLHSLLAVPRLPDKTGFFVVPVLFIISVGLSFFIYRRVPKIYLKKHPFPGKV